MSKSQSVNEIFFQGSPEAELISSANVGVEEAFKTTEKEIGFLNTDVNPQIYMDYIICHAENNENA